MHLLGGGILGQVRSPRGRRPLRGSSFRCHTGMAAARERTHRSLAKGGEDAKGLKESPEAAEVTQKSRTLQSRVADVGFRIDPVATPGFRPRLFLSIRNPKF